MAAEFGSHDDGVAFLVSAGVVFEIVAAMCSSPQTAEINADKRAETLMKWVYLGLFVSAIFVGVSLHFTEKRHTPIIVGGALAGAVLGVSYVYAKQCGLKSVKGGTET